MERRSFLALLGLSSVSGAVARDIAQPTPVPAPMTVSVPTTPVTVPDFPVRMPVKISLTREQVEICECIGMDPVDYARNLIELGREGKLESNVDMRLEAEVTGG